MLLIRRVKCGEEKPDCLRCTKTGRKCDGYDSDRPEIPNIAMTRMASTASSSSASPIASPATSPVASMIRILSPSINGDGEERRSFNFFIDRTAPELAGFFESRFWISLVLQRCHSDPPIRHAAIALGALHESFKFGDVKLLEAGAIDNPKQRFALLQNNKAIRHLTGHLSHGGNPQSPEVILISCLLFICFEAMQGNNQAAFSHLNSGLKILGDWIEKTEYHPHHHSKSNLTQQFIHSELVPLFGALDIQATLVLPTDSFHWGMTMGSTKVDFRTLSNMPDAISTLNEAKCHLQNQTRGLLEYLGRVAQQHTFDLIGGGDNLHADSMKNIMIEKRKQACQLEQWSRLFDAFAQTASQTMDTNNLRASISLKLQHVAIKLILETALFKSEMEYDQYMDQFELMTSLAESLLKSYGDSILENGRVFSFDTAIIPPLLCVVSKCRDPSLRRKAHALMSSSFRREGGWDSDYASSIGRWTIDKEEEGLENISKAGDVLESTRIVVAEIRSLERRRALIKFRQGPPWNAGDTELQEEPCKRLGLWE
ncbi:hypothetical protein NHQ30_008111 [Ciborinia camelliae]|nr:hypothetical protein NHQ30_008111 [Ciborinia camelliae]